MSGAGAAQVWPPGLECAIPVQLARLCHQRAAAADVPERVPGRRPSQGVFLAAMQHAMHALLRMMLPELS